MRRRKTDPGVAPKLPEKVVSDQAASLRPLPDGVAGLDSFRVWRRGRAGGMIHEYRLVA
jgi:hypothetical protein